MELKKQDAGVWVKAEEDGLPDFVEDEVVIKTFSDIIEVRFISWDSGKNFWEDVEFWLKPIKGYVLTEDELKQLLDLSFTVGGAYHVQKYSGKDMMGLQDKKQFIQSITK